MYNIERIIRETFGIEKLQPEKQAEMLQRLAQLVFQGILMKVLPTLTENDLNQYEKIIEEEQGPEALVGFFRKTVPNFDNMVKEEAEELRTSFNDVNQNIENEDEPEEAMNFSETNSKTMEVGMGIVGWVARAFWAILGLIFWIPLLFRIVAAFCATLVYNMVIQNPAAIQKSKRSLELAINFYNRGFEVIRQTTSTNEAQKNVKAKPVQEFDLMSFIAQLGWTVIFWGLLFLPFYWHKIFTKI